MAKRRMFSIDVVGQDNFLDMPTDSRELYFQLGMYADDEGFVSPKKVMRVVGASEDSIKLLVAKKFVYPFKSGVIIITHWGQNNYIQNDRFAATTFKEEKRQWKQLCIQDVYRMDTQGGREVREERKKEAVSSPKNENRSNTGDIRDYRPSMLDEREN